jgi:hypothetical protein
MIDEKTGTKVPAMQREYQNNSRVVSRMVIPAKYAIEPIPSIRSPTFLAKPTM